jgi:hypothetical protein
MDDKNLLPEPLRTQFLGFLREEDGQLTVDDKDGLIKFVAEHGEKYPFLLGLFRLDKEAAIEHFKQTGEVLPGIKIIHTSTEEGSNVTSLEVHRGPKPPRT